MYVVYGDQILDSKEILDKINSNTNFVVEKDLSKATKREDVLAYKVSIKVNILNEMIGEDYDISSLDKDELFYEYMSLSDELSLDLCEIIEYSRFISRSYKWDRSDKTIKCIVAFSNRELSELKLNDVIKRLLTQVD